MMAKNKQESWLRWAKWDPLTVDCFFTRCVMPCVRLLAYRAVVDGVSCGDSVSKSHSRVSSIGFLPMQVYKILPSVETASPMFSNLLILQFVVSHTGIKHGTIFSTSKGGEKRQLDMLAGSEELCVQWLRLSPRYRHLLVGLEKHINALLSEPWTCSHHCLLPASFWLDNNTSGCTVNSTDCTELPKAPQ